VAVVKVEAGNSRAISSGCRSRGLEMAASVEAALVEVAPVEAAPEELAPVEAALEVAPLEAAAVVHRERHSAANANKGNYQNQQTTINPCNSTTSKNDSEVQ